MCIEIYLEIKGKKRQEWSADKGVREEESFSFSPLVWGGVVMGLVLEWQMVVPLTVYSPNHLTHGWIPAVLSFKHNTVYMMTTALRLTDR